MSSLRARFAIGSHRTSCKLSAMRPPFTSKFPAQFTDENVTAWRPNGTLAWRFRSQQFCVGARSTYLRGFLIVDHDPAAASAMPRTTMMSWLTDRGLLVAARRGDATRDGDS